MCCQNNDFTLLCLIVWGEGVEKNASGRNYQDSLKKRGGFLGHSLVIIKLTLVIFSQNLQLPKIRHKRVHRWYFWFAVIYFVSVIIIYGRCKAIGNNDTKLCQLNQLFRSTAWKISVKLLSLRIQSECGKIRASKTPNTGTFHGVEKH